MSKVTKKHLHNILAAVFYDMDGTLTGVSVIEDYTKGGTVRGTSLVARSPLLPMNGSSLQPMSGSCFHTKFSTGGVGGAVCVGLVFRRVWYHIRSPNAWIGKSLCVRPSWTADLKHCTVMIFGCILYDVCWLLEVKCLPGFLYCWNALKNESVIIHIHFSSFVCLHIWF